LKEFIAPLSSCFACFCCHPFGHVAAALDNFTNYIRIELQTSLYYSEMNYSLNTMLYT